MTQRETPQLRSTNWKRTRAFYEEGLGFRVEWEHQFEPWEAGQTSRCSRIR